MQYVNDDMDDLFRRAAENYPLDTKSADWDKIAAELELKPVKAKERIYNDRRLLWLLLLLPLSFVCNHIFNNGTTELVKVTQKESDGNLNTESKTDLPGNIQASNQHYSDILSNKNEQQTNFDNRNITSDQLGVPPVTVSEPDRKTGSNQRELYKGSTGLQPFNYHNHFNNQIKPDAFAIINKYPFLLLNIPIHFPGPVVKETESSKSGKNQAMEHKFYFGIMGGIDATSIKFQKISHAGYSIGVLFGFKLNRRWSIETGLFHDKKYYYSEGQYLNTSKMYILPGTKIQSLDGNCSMWEVPLQGRYNFKNANDKIWFSTLGLSSYFMKKENYDYTYSYNSTGQTYDKYRSYNNASKHFFSVITLSTGVTSRINKTIDLRIEPYLKIPVKGVGVGSISLQSAGLQVGITKTIF